MTYDKKTRAEEMETELREDYTQDLRKGEKEMEYQRCQRCGDLIENDLYQNEGLVVCEICYEDMIEENNEK